MRKLYIFDDKNLDRQIMEIVTRAFGDMPVYADNTAAIAGGLKKDQPYRTATGQIMVVY